jgi:1,4-dihydroxy-2-naphthoate octaprenyltransferase
MMLSASALIGLVFTYPLPVLALVPLLALVPALKAGRILSSHAHEPARLVPALQMTIVAAHVQPVLLAAVLAWVRLS